MKFNRAWFVVGSVVLGALAGAQVKDTPTKDGAAFQKKIVEAAKVYKQGRLDEALKSFEALYAESPANVDVDAWLGFLYLRTNKADRAVPLLEKAATQRTADLEVLNNLGNAYFETKQYDKALERYAQLTTLSPKMYEPHYNSGNIYLARKDLKKAISEFEKAAALKPEDAYVQNNLGVAFQAEKDQASAAKAFRKASDLLPENRTLARNAGLAIDVTQGSVAASLYLERAYDPKNPDPEVSIALGNAYMAMGKKAEALKVYELVKGPKANTSTYWYNLAVLRAQGGDQPGAESAYVECLKQTPDDLDALNNLGLLQYRRGAYAEAETTFDHLVGLSPQSENAKVNLGAAAAKSGHMDRAVEMWKAVVRAQGSRNDVRLNLANALWDQGDLEGSRYHYLQVLKTDKENAEALNGIGLIHLRGSKLPQAEAAFRSSIQANSHYAAAYNNLAITLERMNRKTLAIQILEKGLKAAPSDPDLKKNLSRLRAGS